MCSPYQAIQLPCSLGTRLGDDQHLSIYVLCVYAAHTPAVVLSDYGPERSTTPLAVTAGMVRDPPHPSTIPVVHIVPAL